MNPARPRPTYTFSNTRSLPGVMHAATAQKAAWEGSAGTSVVVAWSGPGRKVTVAPASFGARRQCSLPRRPAFLPCGHGWPPARAPTVVPSAPNPAKSTADFTWALATGQRVLDALEAAAAHGQWWEAATLAPVDPGAHQPERYRHPVHRPLGDRRVAL